MTALLMLHNSAETALVWRRVADNLPQLWAIVAPNLHLKMQQGETQAQNARIDAMEAVIERDLQTIGIREPVVIIASGDAAIIAVHYYRKHPQQVRALFLTEPILEVKPWRIRFAKLKPYFSAKRKKPTISQKTQRIAYLKALLPLGKQKPELPGVKTATEQLPVRILVAAKERRLAMKMQALAKKNPNFEYFTITGAQAGWNDYAPANYASNIREFLQGE